jgi:Leucine-rich repeat (LRR) protein
MKRTAKHNVIDPTPIFPNEIWSVVLMQMSLMNENICYLFRFATVSKSFNEILPRCILTLDKDPRDGPEIERRMQDSLLKGFINLTTLILSGGYFDHITDNAIQELTNLTTLDLFANESITERGLEKLKNLTSLNLSSQEGILSISPLHN